LFYNQKHNAEADNAVRQANERVKEAIRLIAIAAEGGHSRNDMNRIIDAIVATLRMEHGVPRAHPLVPEEFMAAARGAYGI